MAALCLVALFLWTVTLVCGCAHHQSFFLKGYGPWAISSACHQCNSVLYSVKPYDIGFYSKSRLYLFPSSPLTLSLPWMTLAQTSRCLWWYSKARCGHVTSGVVLTAWPCGHVILVLRW